MQLRSLLFVLFFLTRMFVFAQDAFVPNQGQWNSEILFQADIKSGRAFLKENGVRYSFFDANTVAATHERIDSAFSLEAEDELKKARVECYAYEMNFVNGNSVMQDGMGKQKSAAGYFLGSDASKWRGGLPMFNTVKYSSLYDGIDVIYHNKRSSLKYDFIVAPNADVSEIQMQYTGQRSLAIRNNALVIDAGFLQVTEIIPAAFQFIHGKKTNVRCEYVLTGNIVSFRFPDGYDTTAELIIDPEVVASTYSGGTAMCFGFTSTPGDAGEIYVAGVVYAQGYPVTLGAYDLAFDSMHDIAISKFDATGSNLLNCTYVGGSGEEFPFSTFVHNGNLYVYGKTNGQDFPTTVGAFDQTHNGQEDIVVFYLSGDLSTLIASTFVGSTGHDGVNYINLGLGDGNRGEIVVDASGNVYIASGSTSQNFPVTPGAYVTTYSGGVDVVAFKLNPSLSTMIWCSFLGASLNDAGMGIRVDDAGYVYVCGTYRGLFGGFQMVPGGYQTTFAGGGTDVFVAKFDPTGSTLVACTFYGGPNQDVGYFIDLDSDGDVYVTGLRPLDAPVTPGVYSNPGSINFIAKFDPSLATLKFSTVIGDGTTAGKVLPTAFMVDNCKRIYLGGFGGSQNWPLTGDALFTTWDAHTQWYLACLTDNAGSLLFGSLYGSWHCDGGTSRFDKDGIVYQAVCADSAEFPITPWAYADGTNTHMWDICVFKIDFQIERDSANLPNVFTPNGDGINDVYEVGLNTAHFFEVKIFNRWGVQVFSSTNLTEHWDGTYRKNECEEGVYYVECKHGYCLEDPHVTTGFVHLIRGN